MLSLDRSMEVAYTRLTPSYTLCQQTPRALRELRQRPRPSACVIYTQDHAAFHNGLAVVNPFDVEPDLRWVERREHVSQEVPFSTMYGALCRLHTRAQQTVSLADHTYKGLYEFRLYEDLMSGEGFFLRPLFFALPCGSLEDYKDLASYFKASTLQYHFSIEPWSKTSLEGLMKFSLRKLPSYVVQDMISNAPGATWAEKNLHLYLLKEVLGLDVEA